MRIISISEFPPLCWCITYTPASEEDGEDGDNGADAVGIDEPDARRDAIMSAMWDQYLQAHVDRGLSLPGAM